MKTCVVTATYGCAPNKVWLYMTNPTLNSGRMMLNLKPKAERDTDASGVIRRLQQSL